MKHTFGSTKNAAEKGLLYHSFTIHLLARPFQQRHGQDASRIQIRLCLNKEVALVIFKQNVSANRDLVCVAHNWLLGALISRPNSLWQSTWYGNRSHHTRSTSLQELQWELADAQPLFYSIYSDVFLGNWKTHQRIRAFYTVTSKPVKKSHQRLPVISMKSDSSVIGYNSIDLIPTGECVTCNSKV